MFQEIDDGLDNAHLLANQLNRIFTKVDTVVEIIAESAIIDGKFCLKTLVVSLLDIIRPIIKFSTDAFCDGNKDILHAQEDFDTFCSEELRKMYNSQERIDMEEFILKLGRLIIAWMQDSKVQAMRELYENNAVHAVKVHGKTYPKNVETLFADVYSIVLSKLEALCKCEHGSRQQFLYEMNIDEEVNELFEVYHHDHTTTTNTTNNTSKQLIRNICSSLINLSTFKTKDDLLHFGMCLNKWIGSADAMFNDQLAVPSGVYEYIHQVISLIEYVLDSINRIDVYSCEEAKKFWLFWQSRLQELSDKLVKMDSDTKTNCIMGVLVDEFIFWGSSLISMDLQFLANNPFPTIITLPVTNTTTTTNTKEQKDSSLKRLRSPTITPSKSIHPAILSYSFDIFLCLDYLGRGDCSAAHNVIFIEKFFARWLYSNIYMTKPMKVERKFGKMKNVMYAQELHAQFLAKHGEEIKIFYQRHKIKEDTDDDDEEDVDVTELLYSKEFSFAQKTTASDDVDADAAVDESKIILIDWENFIQDFVTYILGIIECLDETMTIRELYNQDIWEFLRAHLLFLKNRIEHGQRYKYATTILLGHMAAYAKYIRCALVVCEGCERGETAPAKKMIRLN